MKRANIRAVISELGGASAVAAELGVSRAAAYDWVRSNSLPLERAMALAERLGIDRDMLHDPWVGRGQETMTEAETRAAFNWD